MSDRLRGLTSSPAAGFDQPFEMLQACHERVGRTLDLLQRLRTHVAEHGCDAQARQAAADVLRYFDIAAPQHHLDEERHVLPALRASGDAALMALADRLQADHRAMETGWAAARAVLQGVQAGVAPAADADASLTAFAALYTDHMADEEGQAFPSAHARLDAAATAAMGEDMRRRRGAA